MNPSHNPEDRSESLADELTRPDDIFKGEPLWPLTRASQNYFLKATGGIITPGEQARIYWFIHRRRGGATFKDDAAAFALLLFSDMGRFLVEANALADELNDDEAEQLNAIVADILSREERTRVSIGSKSTRVHGVVKKKATTRVTPPGKPRPLPRRSASRGKT